MLPGGLVRLFCPGLSRVAAHACVLMLETDWHHARMHADAEFLLASRHCAGM